MRKYITFVYVVIIPIMVLILDYLVIFKDVGADFDLFLYCLFTFLNIVVPFIAYHMYSDYKLTKL